MAETYQRLICVAGGPDTAVALREGLDRILAHATAGTLAIGEFPPNTRVSTEPSPTAGVELDRLTHAAALGGVASHWRHTLNNSLAALLAEAQLLGMEALPPSEHESVERIIALCRRMIVVVREGPPSDPPSDPIDDTPTAAG
jgi:signal transduction histidine kinase